jgi:hypothetical protein
MKERKILMSRASGPVASWPNPIKYELTHYVRVINYRKLTYELSTVIRKMAASIPLAAVTVARGAGRKLRHINGHTVSSVSAWV